MTQPVAPPGAGLRTDEVRVESVVTHHKRLRQAFLLGRIGERRDITDGVRSFVVSIVLAAVACAGCVGYGFVRHVLATQAQASSVAVVSTAPTDSPSPAPAKATPTATRTRG